MSFNKYLTGSLQVIFSLSNLRINSSSYYTSIYHLEFTFYCLVLLFQFVEQDSLWSLISGWLDFPSNSDYWFRNLQENICIDNNVRKVNFTETHNHYYFNHFIYMTITYNLPSSHKTDSGLEEMPMNPIFELFLYLQLS